MKNTIIELEDCGQDFTRFVVSPSKEILDVQPFQGWVWAGNRILNKSIRPGARLRLLGKDNVKRYLR